MPSHGGIAGRHGPACIWHPLTLRDTSLVHAPSQLSILEACVIVTVRVSPFVP
jgi:hypothetical protein